MARYIDADELIKIGLQDGAYEYVSVDEIANFPTADVRPVVKGEWKDVNENQNVKRFDHYECSICHMRYAGDYNFCPNCGSQMRGVRDDNN